jgi:hypothetical protein
MNANQHNTELRGRYLERPDFVDSEAFADAAASFFRFAFIRVNPRLGFKLTHCPGKQ